MENFKIYLKEKAGLSADEVETLTNDLIAKAINKGEFLLHEADICQYSFFVDKGLLRSYIIDDAGKEHIIQFAPENWFITDRSSAYFKEPSELNIDAIEDSAVIFLDDRFMERARSTNPAFIKYNEKALHNFIRHQQQRINLLLSATAEERYLNFVNIYPDLMLRVPQWMIASFLGLTPESLSRVRKELSRKNFKPQ
ncbi:MAG: Crp/Fnr family transcriptional regulator [Ginsengibacter sp.]